MRIKAKDPHLVSLMGEFMRIYLPGVRNRDKDTIDSYRYSINLFVTYLESEQKVTVLTMQSSDFSQKNIVEFMAWLKSERNNVAPTINHRLSDLRGFCKYLYKKNAISLDAYEAIREISDVDDERILDFTWLSVNDVYLVLKSTDSNREAVRDRFLLSLLYESGARINEVLSLKLLDIKATSNGEADVHFYGKGKKHRITPLGIMQVGSDADLTDEESINLAYFKLKDEIVRGNIVTDDEGEINHYAFQYNPDEDYARSITYIYQRLCGYLKSTQRFYIAFHLEEHPEEESPVDPLDEAMMSFGEPKSYLTFDDVRILTGLSKKELKKKLKEKQIVAMYDEDAVRQAFDEDIC